METVRVERLLEEVEPRRAFDFVVDVDNYARLAPNVNQVRIVEHDGSSRITSWDTEIEGAPLLWTERDTILPDELTIRFESIDGDFDVFRGAWLVVPHGAGVVLACELEYSLGVAILDELVGPILKQKIVENLSIMLDGLTRGLGGG